MENARTEALICGKILLYTTEREISFICEICYKELKTLPELLGHVFSEHVKGLPQDKLRELCRIQAEQEDDFDTEMMIQEIFDNPVKKEPQVEYEEADKELAEESRNKELKPMEDRLGEYEEEENPMEQNKNDDYEVLEDEWREDQAEATLIERTSNDEKEPIEDDCEVDISVTNLLEIDIQLQNAQFEFMNVQAITNKREEQQVAYNTTSKRLKQDEGPSKKEPSGVECNVCFKRFKNKRVLMEHKKEHGDRPYVCNRCGAGFRDKTNMQVHYLRHLGIKPHACKLCAKTFTTSTELKIHIRSHTGEHPYKCLECDKEYITASQLAAHRRRHTNLRPYLCNVCGRTFYDRVQFVDHVERHSTERPHKCTECNASFTVRKGLRQHMKLHSGVKKYSCECCGKRFAQQAGVYSHVKSNKNECKLIKQ